MHNKYIVMRGPGVKRIGPQQHLACRKRRLNRAQNPGLGLGHSVHGATGLCAPGNGMGYPGMLVAVLIRPSYGKPDRKPQWCNVLGKMIRSSHVKEPFCGILLEWELLGSATGC